MLTFRALLFVLGMHLLFPSLRADLPQALDTLRDRLENLAHALQGGVKKGKDVPTTLEKAFEAQNIDAFKDLVAKSDTNYLYNGMVDVLSALKTDKNAEKYAKLIVDELKKKNKSVDDLAQGNGETILMTFAARANEPAVKFLLNNGANPEAKDVRGNSVLDSVGQSTDPERVGVRNVVQKAIDAKNKGAKEEGKKTETVSTQIGSKDFKFKTFKEWNDACENNLFPHKAEITNENQFMSEDAQYRESKKKVLTVDELIKAFEAYRDLVKPDLTDANKWLDGKTVPATILPKDMTTQLEEEATFVERFVLNPDSKCAIHGDWHGDIHSLLHFIRKMHELGYMEKDSFKINDSKVNFVFLGDTVDRGLYSLETVYTLIRLKLENNGRIFITRGNHETRDISKKYGLFSEIGALVAKAVPLFNAFNNWFNLLPSAIYLGCADSSKVVNYVQCCHGGIEIGYNPAKLLGSQKAYEYLSSYQDARAANLKLLSEDPTSWAAEKIINESPLGLQWSDFNPIGKGLGYEGGRPSFDQALTKKYLDDIVNKNMKQFRLQGFLRAHQHNGQMFNLMVNKDNTNQFTPGIAKLWEKPTEQNKNKLWPDIVCTFIVAPNTNAGKAQGYYKDVPGTDQGVIKDFWGLLTIRQNFSDWTLEANQILHKK